MKLRTIFIVSVMITAMFLPAHGAQRPGIEERIIRFVKEMYSNDNDVRVKLNSIPEQFRLKAKMKNINFVRVPDANGDGVCAVEIKSAAGHTRTIQVPFKVFTKRRLFILRHAGQKGDIVGKKDIYVRETYMKGRGADHPPSEEDVIGKSLKRNVPANTVITGRMLEAVVAVKRGDLVTIMVENERLIVQTKGKTIDKGCVGDTIRVKNIASGREIMAKVVDGNTVKVEF